MNTIDLLSITNELGLTSTHGNTKSEVVPGKKIEYFIYFDTFERK